VTDLDGKGNLRIEYAQGRVETGELWKMPKRTVEGEGKKSPLNMRTTPALREKLEVAAGESGRSLVQEVEYRLEQSFATDALLGGKYSELPRLITLAMMLGPKGPHRARALQEATRVISEAFFSPSGLSEADVKNQYLVGGLNGGDAGIAGVSIAITVLAQAGLAKHPVAGMYGQPAPQEPK
jgi:hypothetical protein